MMGKLHKQLITSASLKHSFDRRATLIAGLQGGIGLLLATRMGYLAIAENEKYRVEPAPPRKYFCNLLIDTDF